MQKYNPLRLVINMPVNYIPLNTTEIITGHYAFVDEDGYHYVFEEGGTSYTRIKGQVIKCKAVWALDSTDQAVFRTEQLTLNNIVNCKSLQILNSSDTEDKSFIIKI